MSRRQLAVSVTLAVTLLGASFAAAPAATASNQSRIIVPATGLPLGEMPTTWQRSKAQRALRLRDSAPAGSHLTYYGGPIISSAHVNSVLWGAASTGHVYIPQVTATSGSSMDSFLTHVSNSAHISWLKEYNTPTGTNQTITYGSFGTRTTLPLLAPTTASYVVTDSTIQTALATYITNGMLPAPTVDATGNVNSVYALFFPSNVTIQDGSGNQSGVVFCAYHGETTSLIGGVHVPFLILPDPTSGGMALGCGTGSSYQNLQSYTSHELVETMTDPAVDFATVLGPPLGWYDQTNGEIGDICNAQQALVTGTDGISYTVQTEFSNSLNNCIAVKPNTVPGAATSLAVVLSTPGTAHLTWGSPTTDGGTAILSWTIYRSTNGTLGTSIATLGPDATSVDDNAAAAGQTYYYTVVANNINGSGTPSQQVSLSPPSAPGAPTAVSSFLSGADAITTSWTAPATNGGAAVSTYSIARYVSGSGTPTHVIDVPASQTTYEESGLTPGVSYEYTVTAANVAGPGAESAHSNAVLAAGPASQPTNASVSATDVGQLTVAWGAPSADGGAPITGYNIYRSAAASGPFALATPTLPANATSYVNGGLATGTTEYYIVAAVSGFGEGTGTQPISAGVEGLPTSSTQISAAVGAGGTATLTWTTPASSGGTPIVGFHAQDNTGTHFCNTNGALSCTISGLTIGSPYTFTVEAFNRWGTGLSSAPSSPIIAADVPSAATITALAAGNKRVQVTWTAPASDGGLAVGQYKVTASPGGAFCQTPGTVTTCFVTGLTNGQHYTFTVVATNSLGDGPGGSPSAQVTPRTVPTAARLLKAVYATGHKTTVTWAGPANTGGAAISAYAVRWSTNGKTWSSWTTTHLTRTWTHVGFKKGAHAYVQIAAVNAAGRGAAAQLTLTPTK